MLIVLGVRAAIKHICPRTNLEHAGKGADPPNSETISMRQTMADYGYHATRIRAALRKQARSQGFQDEAPI